MIKISNKRLVGRDLPCFNPTLVSVLGKRWMYFRYIADRSTSFTRIAAIELGDDLQPVGQFIPIELDGVTSRIVSFEDPRTIVWRDEVWLFHGQASFDHRGWSAATLVARLSPGGKVLDLHVPDVGHNLNAAVSDGPPGIDRNWTPFVWNDELYIIYEISPLTVYRLQPDLRSWQLVTRVPWNTGYDTYLSGGTPLVPWRGDEYIGMFHAYKKSSDDVRTYFMGFYSLDVSLDVARWRISGVSSRPVMSGWNNFFEDSRRSRLKKWLRPVSKGMDAWQVVFPCGILDQNDELIVSLGWNDSRCYLERYPKLGVGMQLAQT